MTLTRLNPKAVGVRLGAWEIELIDNRPTWAFSFMRWRHEGGRGWRVRLGPLKAQGQHAGCTEVAA